MVRVAEKAKASVWVSPFSARCSFPERHPQFAGFLHASPGQLSDALRDYDLVVVIGAPVFTFHVEGHASIFDGATAIFQITDDPDAAAVTPSGASIIATMKPALAALLDLLPESKRAMPAGRKLPPAPSAADPLPVEFLLHSLAQAAAHRRRHQQCRLRRDALVQPGDAGAQRAGPRTARHRFRQTRRRHGLPRRAGDEIVRARGRTQLRHVA